MHQPQTAWIRELRPCPENNFVPDPGVSFGFSTVFPPRLILALDVPVSRRNSHCFYLLSFSPGTGLEEAVARFVPAGAQMPRSHCGVSKIRWRFTRRGRNVRGKAYPPFAIIVPGGRHRSVAMTVELFQSTPESGIDC